MTGRWCGVEPKNDKSKDKTKQEQAQVVVFFVFEGCDAPDEMRGFFASLRMTRALVVVVSQRTTKARTKQSKNKRKLWFL